MLHARPPPSPQPQKQECGAAAAAGTAPPAVPAARHAPTAGGRTSSRAACAAAMPLAVAASPEATAAISPPPGAHAPSVEFAARHAARCSMATATVCSESYASSADRSCERRRNRMSTDVIEWGFIGKKVHVWRVTTAFSSIINRENRLHISSCSDSSPSRLAFTAHMWRTAPLMWHRRVFKPDDWASDPV